MYVFIVRGEQGSTNVMTKVEVEVEVIRHASEKKG